MSVDRVQVYNGNVNQQLSGVMTNSPQYSTYVPPPYQEGVVVDVITNEQHPRYGETGGNVGLAFIRLIPGDRYKNESGLLQALPANPFFQAHPLRNEMVHVKMCSGRPCYEIPLNITNKVGEQTYPNLNNKYAAPISSEERVEAAQRADAGIDSYTTEGLVEEFTFGEVLRKLNPFAKKLRAEEGDLLIQGRFGNAIRLGSSLTRHPTREIPQPNILLTAGQWPAEGALSTTKLTPYSLTFENINDDKSCIWMVADQEVDFLASTIHTELPREQRAHLRSSDLAPDRPQPQYTGAQIFISSDRVVLNSKRKPISLFSKSEINLSARQSITIDTEKSAYITANENIIIDAGERLTFKAKNLSFINAQDLSYGTAGDYVIVGKNIFIGKRDTTQPMVMGASLAVWLQDLMDAFIIEIPRSIASLNPQPFVQAITQLRLQLGAGTSGLPTPVRLQLAAAADFNSRSNFVSRTNINDSITPDTIV